MTIRTLAASASVAALAFTAADAHPRLQTADPAPGAVLKASPASLRMTFSEGLVPQFTGVAVNGTSGAAVATGPARFGGPDNTSLSIAFRTRLRPGTYNVVWHAVSVDTHRVKGSYSFRIAR